jgi:hypothetical protein
VEAGSEALGAVPADRRLITPVPDAFFAATWNTYAVPFVRPVILAHVFDETPSAAVVHVPPPGAVQFVEY